MPVWQVYSKHPSTLVAPFSQPIIIMSSYKNSVALVYGRDINNVLRILLVIDRHNRLNIPGGIRDAPDTSSIYTALRELDEETCIHNLDKTTTSNFDTTELTHFGVHKWGSTDINCFYTSKIVNDKVVYIRNNETVAYLWYEYEIIYTMLSAGTFDERAKHDIKGVKYNFRKCCVSGFLDMFPKNISYLNPLSVNIFMNVKIRV